MSKNNYQRITNQIVDMLERVEAGEWEQPWDTGAGLPCNGHTGRSYSGVNILLLWSEAMREGYSSSQWMTYRQAQKEGGNVRKGESGTKIVYFQFIEVDDEDADDEDATKTIPLLKTYTVFNREQIEGLDEEKVDKSNRIEEADQFLADSGVKITEGPRACYSPSNDCVTLPPMQSFGNVDRYYSTAFHELVHWTGAEHRMDRNLDGRFGGDSYAFEELVAELGAAFIAADFRLESRLKEESAKYIKSWIEVLKEDKYAIFTASREAKNAVEYLNEEVTEEEGAEAA